MAARPHLPLQRKPAACFPKQQQQACRSQHKDQQPQALHPLTCVPALLLACSCFQHNLSVLLSAALTIWLMLLLQALRLHNMQVKLALSVRPVC